MHDDRCAAPASLPSPALARRLADLCGDERNLLVDFLLHLSEFDSREAWAAAGYGSLWAWCTEVLHLREGATARRIGAMKLLRRFPSLEAPLRDGRLCLTTVNQLGPLLDSSNVDELVSRAAFLSKADTARLVVTIRPVEAPRDGIRKLPTRAPAADAVRPAPRPAPIPASPGPAEFGFAVRAHAAAFALSSPAPIPRPTRAEVRPIAADTYSLHVTLDAAAKAELDELVALLSHKTGGNLAATLREAVRCGIAQHGKRKGAVEPVRKRAAARPALPDPGTDTSDPRFIPMEVKRAVWKRDGGRCAWVSPDGKRCGCRHKLEFGHVEPVALGGKSTIENVRLECRAHNRFEAVRVFGPKHMAPYLAPRTASSGSDSACDTDPELDRDPTPTPTRGVAVPRRRGAPFGEGGAAPFGVSFDSHGIGDAPISHARAKTGRKSPFSPIAWPLTDRHCR